MQSFTQPLHCVHLHGTFFNFENDKKRTGKSIEKEADRVNRNIKGDKKYIYDSAVLIIESK